VRVNIRRIGKDRKDLEAQGLFSIDHNVAMDQDQLDSLLNAIQDVTVNTSQLVDQTQAKIMTLFQGAAESTILFISKTLVTLVLMYRVRDDHVALVLALGQYMLSLGVVPSVVDAFRCCAMDYVKTLVCQSVGLQEMFTVVGFFLSAVALGVAPSLSSLGVFYKNVCSCKFFSDTLVISVDVVRTLINSAIHFVKTQFLGFDAEWEENSPYDVCGSWCDRVDQLFEISTKSEWTDDMLEELDYLAEHMLDIQKYWRVSKPPVAILGLFQTHANVVRKMLDSVAVLGVRQVPRLEPTFVMLQGNTNLGKSLITPVLSIDLVKSCVSHVDGKVWSSYVYNRNAECEFWEGYTNQKVVVYDDFAQLFDTNGAPNKEFLEIIRLGNSAPYFLNMAHLEMKGRTRMSCDFVLMSCNKTPGPACIQSLREPDAVLRRVDFLVNVDVKEEYKNTNGSINYERVLSDHALRKCGCDVPGCVDICLGHYVMNLKRWNGSEWAMIESNLSYANTVKCIENFHKDRRERGKQRLAYINSRLDKDVFLEAHSGDSLDISVYTKPCLPVWKYLEIIRLAQEINDFELRMAMLGNIRVSILSVFDRLCSNDLVGYHNLLVLIDSMLGLEAQGGDDTIAIIKKSEEARKLFDEWCKTLPSTSDMDWSELSNKLITDEWNGVLLDALCDQLNVQLPDLKLVSTNTSIINRIKESVFSKVKLMREKPFFSLLVVTGVSTVVTLLASVIVPIFMRKKEVEIGDVLRLRTVGSEFKKTFVKRPGLTVDENDEEIYIRVNKGQYMAESAPITGEKGYARKDRVQMSYQKWSKGKFEAHAYDDPNLQDVEKLCIKNMVQIFVMKDDKKICAGCGLLIGGRSLLTFSHILQDRDSFIIQRPLVKGHFDFKINECVVRQLSSDNKKIDAIVIELPKAFPLCRDIRNHFASINSLSHRFFRTRLISMRGSDGDGILRVASGEAELISQPVSYFLNKDGTQTIYSVGAHYEHDMDTVKGDCGAVMVQSNSQTSAKILGIHVAGATFGGDAPGVVCPIYREMLDECAILAPNLECQDFNLDETALSENLEGFDIIGRVDKGASDAINSLIRKSPLNGVLAPCVTAPAVLFGSVEGVDIKSTAIRKNEPRDRIHLDKDILERSVDEAKRKINLHKLNSIDIRERCLTIQEAVFGVEGDDHIGSLNVASSCGYPWSIIRRRRGKHDFIDLDDKWIDQRLVTKCNDRVERAKKGLRTCTVFVDHLKDERRALANGKFLKPRLFSGGPLDFTIVFRQYFASYMAFIMRNRIKNSVAVGVNVHDHEWTVLAERLLQQGDNILAGDFSNYDGTLQVDIVWAVLDVINDWYRDGNDAIRQVLWSELVSSVHLYRNVLYIVPQGNPSGNPMTTMLNSIYQYIAWCYVIQERRYDLAQFVKRSFLVTFGDDNIMSVRDAYIKPQDMIDGFANIGMVLTSESKDRAFDYRRLEDVRFLKRRFSYNDKLGRYLAPLPIEVIWEMPMWYHAPNNWKDVRDGLIESAVRESAHLRDEEEKYFRDKLSVVSRAVDGYFPALNTRDEYREMMLCGSYLYIQNI
jgi:hypothetical protein